MLHVATQNLGSVWDPLRPGIGFFQVPTLKNPKIRQESVPICMEHLGFETLNDSELS